MQLHDLDGGVCSCFGGAVVVDVAGWSTGQILPSGTRPSLLNPNQLSPRANNTALTNHYQHTCSHSWQHIFLHYVAPSVAKN